MFLRTQEYSFSTETLVDIAINLDFAVCIRPINEDDRKSYPHAKTKIELQENRTYYVTAEFITIVSKLSKEILTVLNR